MTRQVKQAALRATGRMSCAAEHAVDQSCMNARQEFVITFVSWLPAHVMPSTSTNFLEAAARPMPADNQHLSGHREELPYPKHRAHLPDIMTTLFDTCTKLRAC